MRTVFMGTGEIGLPSLDWLLESPECEVVGVFTQPDRPVGRKQILTPPEVKKRVKKLGVPVFQPEKLRGSHEIQLLRELEPDLIVVMAYGQILPVEVIEMPRLACVNLHASLLPRHRGAAPIQGAIRDGDEETGITLMYVARGLDTGDIMLKEPAPITPGDTAQTLHDKLALVAPVALSRGVKLLAEGKAPRQPQDEALVTVDPKLRRDDGEIDWSREADELERLIRAYHPWPGTFTRLGGKKLKVKPPAKAGPGATGVKPGTILESAPGTLIIACGGGTALELLEVQLEGGKSLAVSAFLAGHGREITPGEQLG